MEELIRKIQNIKAGDVVEYSRGMVYLVPREINCLFTAKR